MTATSTHKQSPTSKTSSAQVPQTAGVMLRQAREQLGLSLAEVATVTRIPRNMLEHLERDRFDEYAAPVFTRGHLINFAREVRLDPESVLLAYERQSGNVRPSLEFEPSPNPPARQRSVSKVTGKTAPVAKAPKAPKAAKNTKPAKPTKSEPSKLGNVAALIRPMHMVTVVLLLCALFAGASFLNGSNATAQANAEFEAPGEDAWSLEKDSDPNQTRWFLEQQPVEAP